MGIDMNARGLVAVVDDDAMVRKSVCMLIESLGFACKSYALGREFLDDPHGEKFDCLVIDVRMPGLSGLEVQRILAERGSLTPVVFITGHGDVLLAVEAMKRGALDFLLKPFKHQDLLEKVQQAIARGRRARSEAAKRGSIAALLATLSPRERQVLQEVVSGKLSRVIATELGIRPKTVEDHRASIMSKMHAGSVAELVQMVGVLSK